MTLPVADKDDAIERLRLALKRLCDGIAYGGDCQVSPRVEHLVREGYREYHACDPAHLPREER
jgi:hypothetical protein